MEEAGAAGANEKVAADLDGASEVVAAAGTVLIFGSSVVLGLVAGVAVVVLEGAKLKVDDAEVAGFSSALSEAAAV